MTFGKAVRGARMAQGVTLREFARRSGITPAYLCDIELDRRVPSREVFSAIQERLNSNPVKAAWDDLHCPCCGLPLRTSLEGGAR